MRFADDKRFALGVLAGCSALPLPLNEPRPEGVVGWGFLLLFELGVLFFLLRVQRGEERWLGNWMLNLMGLVYLPFLILDLTALSSGQLLRPMMHLALFVVLAKLFSLRREKDKWQTLVAIFFVFVTAMATSASPGIVIYMLVFGVLLVRVLSAFARYHLLSGQPSPRERAGSRLTGGAVRLVVLAVLLAIPVFVLLPRFREPFVLGSGSLSQSTSTGFTDEAGLDVIGRIRQSREVALRISAAEGRLPRELRLRGATFDEYAGDRWDRSSGARALPMNPEPPQYRLAQGAVRAEADIWLEPLRARALIVPQETLSVEFEGRTPTLGINRGGALGFAFRPRNVLQYKVQLSDEPVYVAEAPGEVDEPLLDQVGVSQRIRDLAQSVVGEETDALARARAIERHLVANYEYTLDFVGRLGEDPIEEFLFQYRSGHCEYFASSMVLMLRSLGIPARYVTGFLGAEETSLGYSIVRQSNAHAWVEAYVEGVGWQTFEPTPPDGRPGGSTRSLTEILRQAYDFMIFRWDRYVITFSQGDQAQFFRNLRSWWQGLWDGSQPASESRPVAPLVDEPQMQQPQRLPGEGSGREILVLVIVMTMLLVIWAVVRRPRLDPQRAYRRLQAMGERIDVPWNPALAPREYERRLLAACPDASTPVRRLVSLYLQQSFSGRPLLGKSPSSQQLVALEKDLLELLSQAASAITERRRQLRRQAKTQRRVEGDRVTESGSGRRAS